MRGWRKYKLDELYSFGSGLSKPASDFGHGYPFLSFRVVFNNYFLPDVLTDLVDSSEKERITCSIKRGDVFFTRTSETDEELGMSCVALKDYPDATFNGFTKRLRPIRNDIVFPEFIGYYFRWNRFRANIVSMASETTRASLNNSMLASLPVELPSFSEQRAIAAVLCNLDDKIDLLQRQNATLEAMAEALFRQCFVENAKEEWKTGCIPDEFAFTMGQSPSGDSFNEVGLGVPMFQGNADFGFRFPSKRVYTTAPTRFAQPFDTLISVRAPVGAQNMAQEKCCIGRGLSAFRYKKNPSFYSYTYFKLRYLLRDILIYNDEGTVFGSVSKKDFDNLAITVPDESAVANYEKKSAPLNDKIISNCVQIRTLEKLRDTLLPKLMSGEVRVALD